MTRGVRGPGINVLEQSLANLRRLIDEKHEMNLRNLEFFAAWLKEAGVAETTADPTIGQNDNEANT